MPIALDILNNRVWDENGRIRDDVRRYARGEDGSPEPMDGLSVQVITTFGERYLRPLFVIVEMYDKCKYGRVKREWLKTFSEAERAVVSRWYARIYAWYLQTGIPYEGVRMSVKTYNTLAKAAAFFATI